MSPVFGVDCFPRGRREFNPSLIPPVVLSNDVESQSSTPVSRQLCGPLPYPTLTNLSAHVGVMWMQALSSFLLF